VCFGKNVNCSKWIRPTPFDILVGLNYDLNPTRNASGQIYFKHLNTNSKAYTNLLNPSFEPTNVFMITYDNVLPWSATSTSTASFQIFLLANSALKTTYVTFKFTSCLRGLSLRASSGLNYKTNNNLQEVIITDGQHCTSSNVGETGVWVTQVNNFSLGKN
jgi:hypothetical protein